MSFVPVPPGSPTPALSPLYELEPSSPPVARRYRVHTAVYRHRGLILALIATGVGLAALASWRIKPYYQANGSVIITHPSLHNAELTPEEFPPPVDLDRELQTEMSVFGSRMVAEPVITQLDLEERDPEIAAALARVDHSLAKKHEQLDPPTRREIAYGTFSTKLKLLPDKLSSTVAVAYGSRDAALAAEVVNAITAEYLKATLLLRGEQGATASHWMQQQLTDAQAALTRDDQAVADFQRAHALAPMSAASGGDTPLLGRLADLNHDYGAAEADRIAAQADLTNYGGGPAVAALPAELRNPAIDAASANLGAAEQQLSTLEATYRPDFPLVVEARAQLTADQQHLADLRSQVAAGLQQRLANTEQRENALGGLVASINQQAAASGGQQIQLGWLEAQATSARALVDTLSQKLNEVELEASLPPSNIQVLDGAVKPLLPLYPRWPLDLGLGLGLGVVAGLGMALAREHWSETLTGADAVALGLGPALAPIGMIAERPAPRAGAQGLLAAPGAALLDNDGYQKAAANLVARCGAPPRAVLLTSSNVGEGKTTSTCRLGQALAQGGWRTLIVDCDLRQPGCHAVFGVSNTAGVLAASGGRKVAPLPVGPHLDLMPCESGALQPLQPRAMAQLLEQWREHYDYILIDAPPGNACGEAVLLSSLVEAVLVVLRWGRTRLPEAQQLCQELARARAPLLGTLFNRADPGAPGFRIYRPLAVEG